MIGNAATSERGPGRPEGSVTKSTQLAKINMRSALDILRNGNAENPIEASLKIARFLEGMSKRRIDEVQARAALLDGKEFDRIVDTLYKAANIQLRLADFVFPKPPRVELPSEINGDAKRPASLIELAAALKERGLPTWVFGADMPVIEAEPVNGNGDNGNGEIPE